MIATTALRRLTAYLADRALEATIVGSLTRIGAKARQRLDAWPPDPDTSGRVIVITGATSGLGRAAVMRWRASGATVEVVARDPAKARQLSDSLGVRVTLADVGDLEDVARAAGELRGRHGRIDALVHNAGSLDSVRSETSQGLERTIATHLVGPLRLTAELLPVLGRDSRVVWVSSGGMYTEPLEVSALEMPPAVWDGVRAYARAKRAQVTLAELLAERLAPRGVAVHAMHPGWADTPGVARALPRFRAILGPALRTPDQGADTMVWLASAAPELLGSGRFWLDRHPRSTHLSGRTRRADTPAERRRLWDLALAKGQLPEGWPDVT